MSGFTGGFPLRPVYPKGYVNHGSYSPGDPTLRTRLALLAVAGLALPGVSFAGAAELPAVPGDVATFTLRDGSQVTGRLFALGEGGDRIELPDGSQRYFPEGDIVSAGTFTSRADAGTRLLVGRRSGETVKGTFVRMEPGTVVLRLSDRQELPIPVADVRFVEYAGRAKAGSIWTSLPEGGPARDRTMLAPTALRLEPGEIELSFTGLVQPTLSVGILPWLAVSAWTVIPFYQASGYGAIGALRIDGAIAPLPWLHLKAGVQGVVEAGGVSAAPIVAATFGGPDLYGNLALAPVPVGAAVDGQFEKGALTASGGVAVASWITFLAEVWLGRNVDGGTSYMLGAAARAHWSIAAVEFGGFWRGAGGGFVFASLLVDMNPFRAAESP